MTCQVVVIMAGSTCQARSSSKMMERVWIEPRHEPGPGDCRTMRRALDN